MPGVRLPTTQVRIENFVFLLASAIVIGFALYPGRLDGDSVGQLRQGIDFTFGDAHSPLLTLTLGALSDVGRGPAPMFCLQLTVWFIGLYLISDAVIVGGKTIGGMLLSIFAMFPLVVFDFVDIQKDAFLTALIVLLFGISLYIRLGIIKLTAFWVILLSAIYVYCFDLRQNAFLILFLTPLLFVPIRRPNKLQCFLALLACMSCTLLAFFAKEFIDYRLLPTQSQGALSFLIGFDLAGITARTDSDASEGTLPNFMENVRKCYVPRSWEPLAPWGECAEVGRAALALGADSVQRRVLLKRWLGAISAHPLAYLAHRAHHFACLLRIGCGPYPHSMTAGLTYMRPWDAADPPRISRLGLFLERVNMYINGTVLASGWFWLTVLAIEFFVSFFIMARSEAPFAQWLTIATASALIYTGGYAIVGIDDALRYLHVAYCLAVISLPLFVSELRRVLTVSGP